MVSNLKTAFTPPPVERFYVCNSCHLSQKDIVPFPGEDAREFWQRAEERTQGAAALFNKIGMPEYQAIELFAKLL